MTFEVFKPMELAADLGESVRARYAEIAGELVRITTSQVEVEEKRKAIRATDPVEVDAATVDQMRRLSYAMLELLRDERRVRLQLEKWFDVFLAGVVQLAETLEGRAAQARAGVIEMMKGIGFEPAAITAGITGTHPSVSKIKDRLRRLGDLHMKLGNAESGGFLYPPRRDNAARMDQIQAALKEALKLAGSPLADASFV